MRVCKKIINIIIIMLVSLLCYSNIYYVYGVGLDDIGVDIKKGKGQSDTTQKYQGGQSNLEDPIKNPDFYEPEDTTGNNTKFIEVGNVVIGTLRLIGTVVSVIALMVIGLRFMLGSVSERATYKETMIPYLIGVVMVFTIPHVLGIVYDLVKGIQF